MSLQSMLEETVSRTSGPAESPLGLPLELKVLDREVIDALMLYPEGQTRDEFALRALRIGVLALKQAQGQIDTQAVRQEGERLLRNVEVALADHQQLLNERLTAQLKMYFDPQDGRFHERVERLIRQDGELEQLLRRNIGDDDSRLCQTLTQHMGDGSPLMRVLDPEAGDGLTAALRECVEDRLAEQRMKVLEQFSLDNKDSALCRFLKEVQQHYDGVSGNLTEKIDKVVAEFSLDKEESALNRLVGRVTEAQQMITREFTLDKEESALSRLRGELVKLLKDQTEGNRTFQEEVKVAIGELKARKEEAARSTRHGITFEECFVSAVQSESRNTDDVVEHVGGHGGVMSRCYVGDVVVTMGADSAVPGARIVFEAKEDKDYTVAKALAELEIARKNRESQIGVFVFSSKTVPAGCDVFRRYGSSIVVVWDSEDPGTDIYIRVALTLAKALCVGEKRRSSAETADLVAMETGILQIEGRMKDLDQISKSATTIQNGAEKILDSERRLRKTIVEQIENLRDRICVLRSVVGSGADGGPAASSLG